MRNVGVTVSSFIFLFAAFIFYQSLDFQYYSEFGPGPGFFPRWLGGALMILSLVNIWQSVTKEVVWFRDVLPKSKELLLLVKICVSIALFIVIVPYSGFIIAGTLILFILFYPEYKWYSALGMSVATTVIVFIAFKLLLNIPLPVNAIGI